nr:arylsulfatase [Auraticoccus cholistanensis]
MVVLADDLGFSDIGCYGSEIPTPHLDRLAGRGLAMRQFYNTARCSPSRASLLTGLHPHQTGVGILTNDDGPAGYPGRLNDRCVTMAELLGDAGYSTGLVGKWHLTGSIHQPDDAWPTRRGFDYFYGTLAGAGSYYDPVTLTEGETPLPQTPEDFYLTTALGERAEDFVRAQADRDAPFFLYLALTAPHWPLHAPAEAVERHRGRYDAGWDELRAARFARQRSSGLADDSWSLSPRDEGVVAWDEVADADWQARRMEVYAAQVELMDAAVGRVVAALEDTGELDRTLVLFLSDNGGCAEEIEPGWVDELPSTPYNTPLRTRSGQRVRRGNDPTVTPGPEESFATYGVPWANLSNTPFREYKHWVHEGGIATPMIVHWPDGGLTSGWVDEPHQLPDVLATVLEVTGASYPAERAGRPVLPASGRSMLGAWRGAAATDEHTLYFEHEGNSAIRTGRWKLVRKHAEEWELFDLSTDRSELTDLAAAHPDLVRDLAARYESWAGSHGVKPREPILAANRGGPSPLIRPFTSSRPRHGADGPGRG